MALKYYTPTTPGRRHRQDLDGKSITKKTPEKSLLAKGVFKRQGKNNTGKITVRHRGGGVKRRMRVIDFKRNKIGISATVASIEYDPMRTANIAMLNYTDGEKCYILAPEGLEVGTTLMSGPDAEVKVGNALPLNKIPVGQPVHNVEIRPGKGAQMIRSAGSSALIQSREGDTVTLLMPSKELRLVLGICMATIGQLGNVEWKTTKWGKAGRKRLLGWRPAVRGTAMHPDAHPHGGGEGRSGVGLKYPKTPWGKPAMGKKTRSKANRSNRLIIKHRSK